MADYSIEELIRDVRVCLDENAQQSALLASAEYTLQLDDIIKSKIPEALDAVLLNAPNDLLGDGSEIPAGSAELGVRSAELGVVRLSRPADFLKLVAIKMPDWANEVTTVINPESDLYKQQQSRYSGLRGSPERPVVAEVHSATGRVFELYTSHYKTPEYARYIKRYSMSSGSVVSLPNVSLYRPVIYQIAGLVCVTYKDMNQAQALFDIANGLLNTVSEETS